MRSPGLIARYAIAAGTAAAVAVLDLVTKRWASQAFADGPEEIIPGVLNFTYTENPGAAFSMFRDIGSLLALAAFVAIGIVAAALRERRPILEVVGFGLVGGGAIGNVADRVGRGPGLLDGKVIDWIQLPNFPVFNLADSAITVGVGLLLIAAWRSR